ncbi:ABC transporter permease [Aliarcobacter cryaerophilus]|uniref:ABC transporter permease n=1 Tax=Aliarcobacter cryaerophilus TaxID=28198 RepID=UPI003DA55CC4
MKTNNSNRQNTLRALWDYRFFIISSIKTEYRTRFSNNKLGFLWMIIQPLSMVLIYSLILSQIMKGKLPNIETQYAYSIYILSGIIAWTLFSEVLNRCLNIFIENANLLKKISFPRLALPIIVVGSSLVNFTIIIFITYFILALLGHFPFGALHWLPMLVLLTLALSIGLGMFFGILNVFIRDVGQFIGVIMQFWFWLTPIVYMIFIVPEKFHSLILLNPMTGIVMGYQNIILYGKAPDLSLLIYPTIIAIVFLCLTAIIYKKAVEEMADVL